MWVSLAQGVPECVLVLPDGTTVCVGEFVATRLDYYKSRGRYLPPTEPRHVFVSRIDAIDVEGQVASLVFDTGDYGSLTFDEEGVPVICYEGADLSASYACDCGTWRKFR